jgi:hypothetical protein
MERQKGCPQKDRSLTEIVELNGKRFAEIIRKDVRVNKSTFFSPAESSFQMGLLAHEKGFKENPHYHKQVKRIINDLQQMLVVQRGKIAIDFFDDQGKLFHSAILNSGDTILLIQGAHSLRAIEDMQCISVKQGPFLGNENDKVDI